MKLLLLLIFFPIFVSGQFKDEILNTIIKINRLESEDRGLSFPILTNDLTAVEKKKAIEIPSKYDNYTNFQELLKLITHTELVELTKHKNGVVRLFAIRQLIKERDYQFNFFQSFVTEFDKRDTISSQNGCLLGFQVTYNILLQDFSENWNYARSTNATKDLKFLNHILRPIDSFILFKNYDFSDWDYENIFDRQRFDKTANNRILELIKTKFNFEAFDYLRKNQVMLFESIKTQTIAAFENHKKTLLTEHPYFYQRFLRYLVKSEQVENAKSLLQELKDRNYSKESIGFMLMGIDGKLIDKIR